jgi:hypothetical protein
MIIKKPYFSFLSISGLLMVSVLAIATAAITAPATAINAYAQQQAPESDKSQGQGQGPPFNRGICITTGNLNPVVEPKSEFAKEICNPAEHGGQVSNQGQCMQILREAEEAGEPSPFGTAIDTNEECKEAFPYTAPGSNNPND